jgi:hypothetical protein
MLRQAMLLAPISPKPTESGPITIDLGREAEKLSVEDR